MGRVSWFGSAISGLADGVVPDEVEEAADKKKYFYRQQLDQDQGIYPAGQPNRWWNLKDLPVREEPANDSRKYPAADIADDLGNVAQNDPAQWPTRPDEDGDCTWGAGQRKPAASKSKRGNK